MNVLDSKKAVTILTLKILETYTDKDHYLSAQEISELIKHDYLQEYEKKSILSSLKLLMSCDYDIDRTTKGKYALLNRLFDKSEITFLIDAVFSSKAIPGKDANNITNKLSETLSVYERGSYKYLYRSNEINRTSSKDIFYNIEIISEAIEKGQNIKFQYVTYDDQGNETLRFNGYEYQVSPYYLINNFGRYYLLGYRRRYEGTNVYRLDQMRNIKIDEERKIKPITDLEEYKNGFSISKYINDHIYMFGGKTISVKIKLNESYEISYIYDWFGESAKISNVDGVIYADVTCNENAFFYWIMQYGEHFEVVSPAEIVEKIKDYCKKILKKYEN